MSEGARKQLPAAWREAAGPAMSEGARGQRFLT